MRWIDLWAKRAKLWLPALVFLLVNLALLFGYRLVLTVRMASHEAAIETEQSELAELRRERGHLEDALRRATSTTANIDHLREDRFRTQPERLTATMLRVKELARTAGLIGPAAIRYSDEEIEDLGLLKKGITFSVTGTYQDLREFINLLELTEDFLTLEQIRVTEEGQGRTLKISLALSTYFEIPSADPSEAET